LSETTAADGSSFDGPCVTRQVHLLERPKNISEGVFSTVEASLRNIEAGEVLVRNLFMSVDPYMRRSMEESGVDLEPWPIGGPLDGPSVGVVEQSRHEEFKPGDLVEGMSGWQEYYVSDGSAFVPYLSPPASIIKRPPLPGVDPKDYVGILGIASQTAYYGLFRALDKLPDDGTLVVSSASGTVGMMVCQLAKKAGLRVVGSAGSDEKVSWLRENLEIEAFNYKSQSLSVALERHCPDGIDLLFENASPEHFSACLPLMNYGATALIAGFISIYDTGGRVEKIDNFQFVLDSYLTVKGFAVTDYTASYHDFVKHVVKLRDAGELIFKEKIYNGLESAPAALCALFSGEAQGKLLVQIGES
jgi:NADPH-dependent curcumin reductase CurA